MSERTSKRTPEADNKAHIWVVGVPTEGRASILKRKTKFHGNSVSEDQDRVMDTLRVGKVHLEKKAIEKIHRQ